MQMQIAIIDGHDLTRNALEKATVTTWAEYAQANPDVSENDLTRLKEGKVVTGGGGAEAAYTLITENHRCVMLGIKRYLTKEQARAEGFIVDRHCYPWFGYKGARFGNHDPHQTVEVLTTREADLIAMVDRLATCVDEWMQGSGNFEDTELVEEARALVPAGFISSQAAREAAYVALCTEYQDWNKAQGLKLGSADEHVDDESLTEEQRAWLRDFSKRWDDNEREG